ncbi:MAG: hypothetical protein ACJAYB_003583 [Psychromonas sp.]|jgi:hypothetical protein
MCSYICNKTFINLKIGKTLYKSKLETIAIAKAGASLVLDGSKYSKLELIAIAKNIQIGCTLEIENSNDKSKLELIAIAGSIDNEKITFS